MPKTELESKTEAYLRTEVQKRGGLYYKFTSPEMSVYPTESSCMTAKQSFVELKQEHGTLSKLQEIQIARLKKAGATVRVAYGREGARRVLNEVFATYVERSRSNKEGFGIEEWAEEKKETGGIVDDARGQD